VQGKARVHGRPFTDKAKSRDSKRGVTGFGEITKTRILTDIIMLGELKDIAEATFGDLVRAVVDVEKDVVAIGAELHSDLEALLLENGSKQKNLWGINPYPSAEDEEFIEFDPVINMRPS
jgi:hypothetical protein